VKSQHKKVVVAECERCKAVFWQKRSWARFCSTSCRVLSAHHKKRGRHYIGRRTERESRGTQ
jgi:endogenous inhibitor of DNA gyrase (YacG/DUF329 family)